MFQKTFSLLMTLVLVTLSFPIAFAAAEKLTASANVESYPTLTYKNPDGKMYYGQMLSDALVINDDEVVKDSAGNQVAGHFEFRKPEYMPIPGTDYKLDIKFVPDDQDAYSTFTKLKSSLVYSVEAVELVPVDGNDTVPVATEVEAGAALSTSILSGAKYTNPYNAEEPNIVAATWTWVAPETIINSSGYYDAHLIPIGYSEIKVQVYVKVAGDTPETIIAEKPTVPELTYDGVTTWGDIKLEGGTAVLAVEGTEVEGEFTVTEYWETRIVNPGSYEIDVVFTPADPEAALSYSFKISVTVKPASIAFVDNEGNVVENFTFEVDPGIKMSEVNNLIKANLNVPENSVIGVEDYYNFAENDREYKLTVNYEDKNWTGTELYFTIKFKETEIVPKLITVGEGRMKIDCGEYKPSGTFSVYYVVGETETKIGDYKGNSEEIIWSPDASGNYTFKVVYNRAEGDYFKIDSITTYPLDYYPKHNIVATGSISLGHSMGETVTITAPATDPEMLDKPYYGFAGWTDVKGNTGLSEEELANATVSFTMPDEEVELKANYKFSLKLFFEWILQQIIQFYTFIVTAVKDLFALATA